MHYFRVADKQLAAVSIQFFFKEDDNMQEGRNGPDSLCVNKDAA